jgi:acetyl-CoA carboxylase biotin carboxylase subunit
MPSCGRAEVLHMPAGPGVRLDSMLYDGCEISPHYDSMVAKIIIHDKDRIDAIARMRRALMEVSVEGIVLNTDFQLSLLESPAFEIGRYHIGTVEELLKG